MAAGTPPGIGLYRFFGYPAWRWPDKIAVADAARALTFAEVEAQARRLVQALRRAGAGAGDRVALILPNGTEFITAEVAIVRGGMVKVPLNIRFHPKEVLYALKDCAPTLLIATPDYARAVIEAAAEVPSLKAIFVAGDAVPGTLSLTEALSAGDPDPDPPNRIADDDPALIRYTGGTTGRPKGIVHTARSLVAIADDCIRELGLAETDIALHLGHLSHGLNFMWPAYFAVGATQVFRETFEPKAIWRDIQDWRVTWIYMVPTMIDLLLEADDGRADVSSLRTFLYASAPMPVPLLRRAMARFGNIFQQVYTLSEAPVITTMMRAEEHLETETDCGPRLGSIGREVLTMELKLIAEDGREVAPGEVGEIAVRSVNNMACYWNLAEETARTLVDGWVRTGDMARRADDGFLYLADRKKDIIITGAFNVYPKEVEDVLVRHPKVAQAAVVGQPDPRWGEIVTAYVVTRDGRPVPAAELTALCADNLADYKKPRRIEFLAELPLTPVGKISRAELRAKAAESSSDP